eukprot:1179931-Prorocentrum_minimum.AAC.1
MRSHPTYAPTQCTLHSGREEVAGVLVPLPSLHGGCRQGQGEGQEGSGGVGRFQSLRDWYQHLLSNRADKGATCLAPLCARPPYALALGGTLNAEFSLLVSSSPLAVEPFTSARRSLASFWRGRCVKARPNDLSDQHQCHRDGCMKSP